MHSLDLAVIVLLVAWPLARAFDWHRAKPVAIGFALLVVIGLPIYFALELMRWAMVPALILLIWWETQAVGVMVGDLPPASRLTRRLPPLGLAALLVAPAVALPMLVLPRAPAFHPTGPFLVGVEDLVWPDSTVATSAVAEPSVPIRLWFPAEPAPQPTRARRHRDLNALEEDLAGLLPGPNRRWVVRGLTRASMPLTTGMRLSTRQRDYPVLLLSHGYPGSPALLATLATEVASHGYVVATPEHAAGALGMRLPNGRRVPVTADRFDATPGAVWHVQVAADLRVTFALLAALNTSREIGGGRFTGRFRLDEIAWIAEGAAAGAAPDSILPITVLVTLGGGTTIEPGLPEDVARLAIIPAGPVPSPPGTPTTMVVEMPGARVADFTDLAWWSPALLQRAGLSGTVAPHDGQQAIHGLTVAFLYAWTRHQSADLRGLVDSLSAVRYAGGQPAG